MWGRKEGLLLGKGVVTPFDFPYLRVTEVLVNNKINKSIRAYSMVFRTSLTLVPLAAHAQLSFYPMSTEAAFYLRWKHLQRDPVSPGSDCLNEQNDGWDLGTHGVTSSHHLLIPPTSDLFLSLPTDMILN